MDIHDAVHAAPDEDAPGTGGTDGSDGGVAIAPDPTADAPAEATLADAPETSLTDAPDASLTDAPDASLTEAPEAGPALEPEGGLDAEPESHLTPEEENELVGRVEQQVRDALQRRLVFLLTGRTGMGKSSTINTLLGEPVAPVGDYEPTTMSVESYEARIAGIACTIMDTPGLCDDLPEQGKDAEYLERIRKGITQVDCVWFVTRLDETRVSGDEKRGIQMLSKALGPGVWDHAIIVFTFAGKVPPERFKEALSHRTRLIREEIGKYAGPGVAESIPSVAVDNTQEYTHDGRQWLGRLYLQILKRVERKSAQPFTLMVMDRVVVEDDDKPAARPAAAPSPSPSRAAPIRVSKSEFREVLEATWEGVKDLAKASVEKTKSVLRAAGSKVRGWLKW